MKKLPVPGLRMIKSSIAVILCFVVYVLRGQTGTPFYSAIAALWCMRPLIENSVQMARQRILGTFIGAIFGLVLIMVKFYVIPFDELTCYFVSALLIVPIIYTTILLDKKEASYFSCVVFLSITINHIGDVDPYLFVFNRTLDTIIGIVVAVIVNSFRLPHDKRDDILFITGLDDTLLTMKETLTPYSQVELKRMLNEGAKFTISTMRTPASIMEVLKGIKLNLPVIAMDGAVLYNIEDNHFEHIIPLKKEIAEELKDDLDAKNIHYFSNEIIDDRLVIFYGNFNNPVEEKIYHQLKKNPHRNYIKQKSLNHDKVVYLMIIDQHEKIKTLYKDLKNKYRNKLKLITYPSHDYPGYDYIKIYDLNATRENMNQYLKEKVHAKTIVTFGSIPGKYDVLVDGDNNKVIRTLKKMYEPIKIDRR